MHVNQLTSNICHFTKYLWVEQTQARLGSKMQLKKKWWSELGVNLRVPLGLFFFFLT